MNSKSYFLRPHHLLNLVKGYENDYSILEDGLKNMRISQNQRFYTQEDARISKNFYKEISSNPENVVYLINGIDERCVLCSNHNTRNGCEMFLEEKLLSQDNQILNELFSNLKIGDKISVSKLLEIKIVVSIPDDFEK